MYFVNVLRQLTILHEPLLSFLILHHVTNVNIILRTIKTHCKIMGQEKRAEDIFVVPLIFCPRVLTATQDITGEKVPCVAGYEFVFCQDIMPTARSFFPPTYFPGHSEQRGEHIIRSSDFPELPHKLHSAALYSFPFISLNLSLC